MKLTQLLMVRVKFRPAILPKGNIWRGKYRLVRKVTGLDIDQTRRDLDREEKNMFYLRNPYLSKDEYHGMGKEYFKTHEKFLATRTAMRYQKFYKNAVHRTLDRCITMRLNNSDSWE